MKSDNQLDFEKTYSNALRSVTLPEKLREDYKIINCLKESESKNIYLLEKPDHSLFILKQYAAGYLPLAQNEYDMLLRMQSINGLPVPQLADYWQEKAHAYILRTYIPGESLKSTYENACKQSDVSVLQYALELCRIITLLHQEVPPIIHRDIKPENFVINAEDGKLYLIDCDSARVYKNGQEHDTLFVGTPSHVAPETYGYAQSNIQSDVYGLGKTLLYMCCGRSDDAAVQDCCLSADFKRIIQKCIAFSPKDRYKSVEAVERELRKVYRKHASLSRRHSKALTLTFLPAVLLALFAGVFIGTRYFSVIPTGGDAGVADTSPGVTETPSDEQTGMPEDRISFDCSAYKESMDQILKCYYEFDLDGMGKAYDELIAQLYAAEDLQAIEWIDISDYDEIPDNWSYRPYIRHLCDSLACYDRLLYTKIGHFSDYSGMLYNYLDFWLNPNTASPDMPVYQYCNQPENITNTNYTEALIEVVKTALRAAIDQDCLEMPDNI